MEFKEVLEKYKFEQDGLTYELKYNNSNYIIKFEGYAFVLYKEIVLFPYNKLEPIADFKDPNKLDTFLDILFTNLEIDEQKKRIIKT